MTKRTENTILSLLQSMDIRMDGIAGDVSAIHVKLDEHTKILEEHSKILEEHTKIFERHTRLHKEHQKMFKQIADSIRTEMQYRADHIDRFNDHARRIHVLETASALEQ